LIGGDGPRRAAHKPSLVGAASAPASRQVADSAVPLRQRGRGVAAKSAAAPKTSLSKLSQLDKELQQEGEGPVRLGDASIASPFTSKLPTVQSTVDIVRQGRCTLVTTLQMFQILALNCLVSAYSMSVLYLDGVKFGDTQMTIAGLAIAAFFFFVSRSQPLKTLSAERPHSRLFTPFVLCSVLGQFALHMATLLSAVTMSRSFTPTDPETRDPEGKFKPNVLNSVVYLVSTAMTTVTFMANYQGHPFMESLRENSALFKSLLGMFALMLTCACEIASPLNELLELAPLPSVEFRAELVGLMVLDLIGTLVYSRLVRWMFARLPSSSKAAR